MIDLKKIDAIIFDLGGVLIDLHVDRTIEQFKDLGVKKIVEQIGAGHLNGELKDFERGKIEEQAFIQILKSYSVKVIDSLDLVSAWNAMLGDLKKETIELIESLRKTHKVFLLSNTNIIHEKYFDSRVDGYKSYHQLFDKPFYSHRLGLSKPDVEVFKVVLEEIKCVPEKALFFDDSELNINAAREVGIKGVLVEKNMGIVNKFKELGLIVN